MKASERTLSRLDLAARYIPAVALAAVFGWLVGASNLISENHMLVSIIAPTVAGMSVLGVVALSAVLGFVGAPAALVQADERTDRWSSEPSGAAPDEPSHIHIPRRPKGEGS